MSVRVHHQELGAQLAELGQLAVLVDLGQDVHQLLLAGANPMALSQFVDRQKVLLFGVEQVKTRLQAIDLVRLKSWDMTFYHKLNLILI